MSNIAILDRSDPYFANGTAPGEQAAGKGGYSQVIAVDNYALSTRLGPVLDGWDGNVHPFYLTPGANPSAPWDRTDLTWIGQQLGPTGHVDNLYEVWSDKAFVAPSAWGLDTNVGTVWLQRAGDNYNLGGLPPTGAPPAATPLTAVAPGGGPLTGA